VSQATQGRRRSAAWRVQPTSDHVWPLAGERSSRSRNSFSSAPRGARATPSPAICLPTLSSASAAWLSALATSCRSLGQDAASFPEIPLPRLRHHPLSGRSSSIRKFRAFTSGAGTSVADDRRMPRRLRPRVKVFHRVAPRKGGHADMPGVNNELHHFGWNGCSSCLCPNTPHPHVERRYLIVPDLRSSNIHIFDTKPDPRHLCQRACRCRGHGVRRRRAPAESSTVIDGVHLRR